MRAQARQIIADCSATESHLIAPPFYTSEVDSVIRHRVFVGRLTGEEARKAYRSIDRVEVSIYDPADLRQRARQIAERFNRPRVYDSTYAALAEIRGCEFWTADHAFYSAVKNDLTFVKYLADYPMP